MHKESYTANVLAVVSTFYICVKNPPTVEGDFSIFMFAVKRKFLTHFLHYKKYL